jgi:nucleolar protein 56
MQEVGGGELPQIQASITEMDRFSKIIKLRAYQPFTTAEQALENMIEITKGKVTEDLVNFLDTYLPKVKKGK